MQSWPILALEVRILYLIKRMGNGLCVGNEISQRKEVLEIPDSIPNDPVYRLFRGQTNRYSDLSVISLDSLTYIFTLKIEQHHELQVTLPVLNEAAHRAVYLNYKLDIFKQILIDPMESSFPNSLIAVKNDLTGVEYSLRIIPFRSYNSIAFKKGLEEVWLHQKKLSKKDRNLFLTLDDAFVYGINPDQQILALLFERTNSTLFNVTEYRREANWPWTLAEKLTIFQHLLESCLKLKELDVVHRDIRPSNIFFL
jgi:serine/threonine protein kinase